VSRSAAGQPAVRKQAVIIQWSAAIVIEDAQLHGTGVQVDAAIESMWLVVETPVMISFGMGPGA
jgi:hypothetical protein